MNKQTRQDVYNKFNGHCAYCGVPIAIKDMQVDHVIPKSFYLAHVKNRFRVPKFLSHLTESDVNHIDNLMPTCRVCNKWKSAHDLELFRSELQEQVNRLHKTSANYRMALKYNQIKEQQTPIKFYFETL